ncbi:MAG: efflux transporter periplasmic adaptor subunit, partial [Candidatus Omnitrophica bacterium]|nr:efflux transporter periplasmic adaptor subunit [Candidatus Omnitrophota bacterium]
MRNFSGKNLTLIVAAIFLLSGCGSRQPQRPQQNEPEVKAVTIQAERVVLTKELPGRTAAFLVDEIRPQINGLIQKR